MRCHEVRACCDMVGCHSEGLGGSCYYWDCLSAINNSSKIVIVVGLMNGVIIPFVPASRNARFQVSMFTITVTVW